MELREYIRIMRENLRAFFGSVLIVLLVGINFYFFLPNNYRTYLNIDITRAGEREKSIYWSNNDEFYRLQADERFADTVVRWLSSRRFQSDIQKEAGVDSALKLKAKRLSSQMIEVAYVTDSAEQSYKVANSVLLMINDRSNELNADQKISSWFKVVSAEPYIEKNKISFWKMIAISLGLGIFVGFWMVFIFHYIGLDHKKKQK